MVRAEAVWSHGRPTGAPARVGTIIEVRGRDGGPPYRRSRTGPPADVPRTGLLDRRPARHQHLIILELVVGDEDGMFSTGGSSIRGGRRSPGLPATTPSDPDAAASGRDRPNTRRWADGRHALAVGELGRSGELAGEDHGVVA